MNPSGAAAAPPASEGGLGGGEPTQSSGVEFLDAWRAAVQPFPGSVPPFAGCSPAEFSSADVEKSVAAPDLVDLGDVVAASIDSAVATIVALGEIDPSDAEPQVLARLVEGVEQLRRMVDAAATGLAGAIDSRTPFRSQGYFNARTFLKQRAQLSGPEVHRRIQTARLRDRLPEWAHAAHTGAVGVAQSELMARVTSNPRLDPDVVARDAGMLLDDAINLPYVDFERNLRTWEALADPIGDDDRNERSTASRCTARHGPRVRQP